MGLSIKNITKNFPQIYSTGVLYDLCAFVLCLGKVHAFRKKDFMQSLQLQQ